MDSLSNIGILVTSLTVLLGLFATIMKMFITPLNELTTSVVVLNHTLSELKDVTEKQENRINEIEKRPH